MGRDTAHLASRHLEPVVYAHAFQPPKQDKASQRTTTAPRDLMHASTSSSSAYGVSVPPEVQKLAVPLSIGPLSMKIQDSRPQEPNLL